MIYVPLSFNIKDFNLSPRIVSNKYDINDQLYKFDFETVIYDIFYSSCSNGFIVLCPSIKMFSELSNQITDGGGIRFFYYLNDTRIELESNIYYNERYEKIFVKFDSYLLDLYQNYQDIVFSIEINNVEKTLTPNKNYSNKFGNSISITTMSQNNKFIWIKDWLTWYNRLYNVRSLVLIDNNSTDYSVNELDNFLQSIDFLDNYVVVDCKFPYGIVMSPIISEPGSFYYSYLFLQPAFIDLSSLNFLNKSKAVFQCDIDELIYSAYRDVGLLVSNSKYGIIFTNYQRYLNIDCDNTNIGDVITHSDHVKFGSKRFYAQKYIFQPSKLLIDDILFVHDVIIGGKSIYCNKSASAEFSDFHFYHLTDINIHPRKLDIEEEGNFDLVKQIIIYDNKIPLDRKSKLNIIYLKYQIKRLSIFRIICLIIVIFILLLILINIYL